MSCITYHYLDCTNQIALYINKSCIVDTIENFTIYITISHTCW